MIYIIVIVTWQQKWFAKKLFMYVMFFVDDSTGIFEAESA